MSTIDTTVSSIGVANFPTLRNQKAVTPGGPWTARLHVDQGHSFYFDHPLDHVPGMLLVAGLLDLARVAVGGPVDPWPDHRIRLALRFPQFCELNEDVTLHCSPSESASWKLRAEQSGHAVCEGVLTVNSDTDSAPAVAQPSRPAKPAAADLVHRVDVANIMIGALESPDPGVIMAAVLTSQAFPDNGGLRSTDEIIEAARQLCTMLGHEAHGRTEDSKGLWLDVETDIPGGLPRDLPLALRWQEVPREGARSRFELGLVVPGTDHELGTVTIASHTMSRQAYEKKRFVGHAA